MADDWIEVSPEWTIEVQRAEAELQHQDWWRLQSAPGAAQMLGAGTDLTGTHTGGDWTVENWVVENLFRRKSVGILAGEANVGKSLISLDLALSVAGGLPWLGEFECMSGPLYYAAGEGSRNKNHRRLLGQLEGRGQSHARFLGQTGPWSRAEYYCVQSDSNVTLSLLSNPAWWSRAKAYLKVLAVEHRPVLYVFDPLMALSTSVDKEEHVKPILERCRWLAEESNAYVLLVHHFRKAKGNDSQSDLIRGESMWRNLVDDVLIIRKDDKDINTIHCFTDKMRDGEALGATRPAFDIFKEFSQVHPTRFYQICAETGVTLPRGHNPYCLKKITLRHVAYTEQTIDKTTPPEIELTPEIPNLEPRLQAVYNAVRQHSKPVGTATLYELMRETDPNSPGKNIIQNVLNTLADMKLLTRVPGKFGGFVFAIS